MNTVVIIFSILTYNILGHRINGTEEIIGDYKECMNVIYVNDEQNIHLGKSTIIPIVLLTTNHSEKFEELYGLSRYFYVNPMDSTKKYNRIKVFMKPLLIRHLEFCYHTYNLFPEHKLNSPHYLFYTFAIYTQNSRNVSLHVFAKSVDDYPKKYYTDKLKTATGYELSATILFYELKEDKGTYFIVSCTAVMSYKIKGFELLKISPPASGISWRQHIKNMTQELYKLPRFNSLHGENDNNVTEYVSSEYIVKLFYATPFKFNAGGKHNFLLLLCFEQAKILVPCCGNHAYEVYETYALLNEGKDTVQSADFKIAAHNKNANLFVVPFGYVKYNFVTCNGVYSKMTYEFYVQPYDTESWLSFLLFMFVILPVVITFITEYKKNKTWKESLAFYSYIVSYNLECALDWSPTLKNEKDLNKSSNYVLLGWLVAVVTFVNAYKGIFVTELTSPTPSEGIWQNVSEMENFVFIVNHILQYNIAGKMRRDYIAPDSKKMDKRYSYTELNVVPYLCFKEDPDFVYQLCKDYPYPNPEKKFRKYWEMYEEYKLNSYPNLFRFNADCHSTLRHLYNIFKSEIKVEKKDTNNIMRFLCNMDLIYVAETSIKSNYTYTERHFTPFKKALILFNPDPLFRWQTKADIPEYVKITSDCDKIAYIDEEKTLDRFMIFANNRGSDFTSYRKGKEELFARQNQAKFFLYQKPAIEYYKGLQNALAMGFFEIWEEWFDIHLNKHERMTHRNALNNIPTIQSLKLSSNLSTGFYILFYSSATCFLSFILELVSKHRKGNSLSKYSLSSLLATK